MRIAGPGPSKSLGDTNDGLRVSPASSSGRSKICVTTPINASTSSADALRYARPFESLVVPVSEKVTGR